MDQPERQRPAAGQRLIRFTVQSMRTELIGMIVMQGVIRNEERYGMVERYAGFSAETAVSAPAEVFLRAHPL
jgi:hypothetical protein